MIVTLTLNPCIDLSLEVESLSFSRPMRALQERRRAGGKGINVSVVLGILGTSSVPVTLLGGPSGREFLTLASKRQELNLRRAPTLGNTRTNIVVRSREDGRHLKINQRGGQATAEELDMILEILRTVLQVGDFLALCGSLPPGAPEDIYAKWGAEFRAKDCFIALDADGEPLRAGLAGRPHLIKPNREELEQLAGKPLLSEDDILDAADRLVGSECEFCLVSDGPRPAYLVARDLRLRGLPAEATGSAVGAGDAFLAGALSVLAGSAGLLAPPGWKAPEPLLREAFRAAMACGAAAAFTPDTEYFPLDLYARCRHNIRVETL